MILGDSLQVMASLAEREDLRGKVQMIYIDPPYGIKFGSNWQVSARKRDVKDGKLEDAAREAEQIKAFRDTWELGIHSYLAYLRDRLIVARDLLTESAAVFVQIGDENVHLVAVAAGRGLRQRELRARDRIQEDDAGSCGSRRTSPVSCDYVLWYARTGERLSTDSSSGRRRWRRRRSQSRPVSSCRTAQTRDVTARDGAALRLIPMVRECFDADRPDSAERRASAAFTVDV